MAILGSSGGNLYTLGGKDPHSLLGETVKQIQAAQNVSVSFIQFVGVEASLDFAKETTPAHLWGWDGSKPIIIANGTLKEINEKAKKQDVELAKMIFDGEVDGLFLASADPKGANKKAIDAAIEKHIIAAGTGGTSMADAQAKGLNVVAVSGTTGTNNQTRAVSAMYAMSKEWGVKYSPIIGNSESSDESGNVFSNISLRGILMAALPGFIAMALTLLISKIPGVPGGEQLFNTMLDGLPIVIAGVAAKQVSKMDEVAVCAGVIGGLLSVKGGLIGGIIAGILAGILVNYLLKKAIIWHFPGTTANIFAGGFAGLISGLLGYFAIAPVSKIVGNGIQHAISWALDVSPILCGLIAGILIWPAIMMGVYHAAILPLIMLEMSEYGNSFLGTVDMCSLIMVATGINLAMILTSKDKNNKALAIPSLGINFFFGTYAESIYPFIFSNKFLFAGTIISAGAAGTVAGIFNVRGTAYVPAFLGPTLSNNWFGFLMTMLSGVVVSFILTFIVNRTGLGNSQDINK